MRMIRILLKVILFPIIWALTLILWICIFLNSISGLIMGILSLIFALTGIASLLFGLVTSGECLKMMIAAFILFVLPHIGNWLIVEIINFRLLINYLLRV